MLDAWIKKNSTLEQLIYNKIIRYGTKIHPFSISHGLGHGGLSCGQIKKNHQPQRKPGRKNV